jgi:hypothetical protein
MLNWGDIVLFCAILGVAGIVILWIFGDIKK